MDFPEDRERGIRINRKDDFFTAVPLLLSYNFAALYMFFGQKTKLMQKGTNLIYTT